MVQPNDTDSFLGRFQLLLKMSQGGMGTLYLGRLSGPQRFQKLLVIKKIHEHLANERQFVEMLMDEARIAALIQHPNVGSIFELGVAGSVPFIAMEYIHGHNLAELMDAIRQRGSMAWPYAARIISDAAAGLNAAHELASPEGEPMNVVHRDVSPHNILVSYEGLVKVVDFGVAYAAGKLVHTSEGTLKGKIAYMSPEQAEGLALDRRSDVFSLGVVLWECLTLQKLFDEPNEAATLQKVLTAQIPPPILSRSDIPQELSDIIMKALARDRDQRFLSAADFAQALDQLLAGHGVAVTHQQLARVVTELFQEQKNVKDAQIKAALSKGPSCKPDHVGAPWDSPDALADTVADRAPTSPTVSTRTPRTGTRPDRRQRGQQELVPTVVQKKTPEHPAKPESPGQPERREPQEPHVKKAESAKPVPGWAKIGIAAAALLALATAAFLMATGIIWPDKRPAMHTKQGTATEVTDKPRPTADPEYRASKLLGVPFPPPTTLDASPAADAGTADAGANDAGTVDAGSAGAGASTPDAGVSDIPAVKVLDLGSLTAPCRKLYGCYHDLIINAAGTAHEHINKLTLITSLVRDKKSGPGSFCQRDLQRMSKSARRAPYRWPTRCGGRVDVRKRSPLYARQSDVQLCTAVIRCCLALNRPQKQASTCMVYRRHIQTLGVAYCPYMWAQYEEVLRRWKKAGVARPRACALPKPPNPASARP